MFYDHKILTSRRHGMAVVWLIATLGSGSHNRKVSKRDILSVEIVRICGDISSPDVPMALRLQSNLLAGVCRVYAQQCTYVLTDVQSMQHDMRHLVRQVQLGDEQIDLEAGRTTRLDQLLLQDDPTFHPSLVGMAGLPSLEVDTVEPSSQTESVLSPRSKKLTRSSMLQIPDLEIPSSSGDGGGEIDFGPMLTDSGSEIAGMGSVHYSDQYPFDDDAPLPQPGFGFDEQGNFLEFDQIETAPAQPYTVPLPHQSREPSQVSVGMPSPHDPDVIARTRAQNTNAMDMDINLSRNNEFNVTLDDVQPFPSRFQPLGNEKGATALPSTEQDSAIQLTPQHSSSYEPPSTPSSAAAPQRKQRQLKTLTPDKTLEIRNSELIAWQNDYLSNMVKANARRLVAKAGRLAKANAAWFTFAGGINGVGFDARRMLPDNHPLAMFSGQTLYDMLTGADTLPSPPSSRKHSRESEDSDEADREDRRKRSRDSKQSRGRDEDVPPMVIDDGLGDTQLEDQPAWEAEQGRRAPTPRAGPPSVEDLSSVMPWNISALQAGSQRAASRGTLSSAQPTRLSQQRQQLVERGRSVPGSRVTSASPLHGRGSVVSRQASWTFDLPEGVGSSSGAGDNGIGLPMSPGTGGGEQMGAQTQFDLFGPAAFVDTQTAGASQFIRHVLDAESGNFHAFLKDALREQGVDVDRAEILRTPHDEGALASRIEFDVDPQRGITFETLLPSIGNSHVVAAQGLLHALTLATKGMIWIRQRGWESGDDGDFQSGRWIFDGEIWLGVEGALSPSGIIASQRSFQRGPIRERRGHGLGSDVEQRETTEQMGEEPEETQRSTLEPMPQEMLQDEPEALQQDDPQAQGEARGEIHQTQHDTRSDIDASEDELAGDTSI